MSGPRRATRGIALLVAALTTPAGAAPAADRGPVDDGPLAVELVFDYPGASGALTRVEGTLRLLRPPATATALDLEGEVRRGEELFERFRYRYQVAAGETLPLVFERRLRPGAYRLVLHLHDAAADRWFRTETELAVPTTAGGRAALAAAADGGAAPGAATPASDPPAAPSPPTVRVVVPGDGLQIGRTRVEALLSGGAADAVSFELDGKPLFVKRRPPFSVEVDLGRSPRSHRLVATALAADGRELARGEARINDGPHRFAVRLVEPRSIPAGALRVLARAEVELPEGEALDRLELWVNDSLEETLVRPPFAASLPVPDEGRSNWVRAVAYLAGGGAAEDVRLADGSVGTSGLEVDFVELHATALDRRGRPVRDLAAEEIEVREDGARQLVRRFEWVPDQPIHAAVVLDTSSSMVEELAEAERAALRFFSDVLTDRDRAAVLTFADQPRLAVRFTRDLVRLAEGLSGLEAAGETGLWDAVAYSLHYFSGLRGKRAMVLLSDGLDSGSRFSFEEVLDYARRTGVGIYVIGVNVPTRPAEPGLLLDRLARETGGRSFRIVRASELAPIYREIERELRAQYLIAYQSSRADGEEFREVEVRARRSGVELRTASGYYP